jgi:hypothetical protein
MEPVDREVPFPDPTRSGTGIGNAARGICREIRPVKWERTTCHRGGWGPSRGICVNHPRSDVFKLALPMDLVNY